MRPKTYNDTPERSCANCRHSHLVAYKLDLLCFHGDAIEVTDHQEYPVGADCIDMNGESVDMLEGDEYDRIWADRIIDGSAICDQWEPET